MKNVRWSRAFTLIELLVVIAILAVLASIILISVNNARNTANRTKYVGELNSLRTALLIYKSNHGDALPACPGLSTAPNPGACFDLIGFTWLGDALQPLVTEKLISAIPHYPGWPTSSYVPAKDWAYTTYLPNIYGHAGVVATEFSCDPANYATWTIGSLPGIILVTTNQDLPYKKGYTQCDTGAGACIMHPFLSVVGHKRYCLPLNY